MEELLCGHVLRALTSTFLLDSGEKFPDLLLIKLSLFHDKQGPVFCRVASEAPKQPDHLELGVLVENARQNKLSHIEALCLDRILLIDRLLVPFVALFFQLSKLSFDQIDLLADTLTFRQGHRFRVS